MPKTSIEFVVATLIVFTGGIVAGVNIVSTSFSEQAYAPTTFVAGAAASDVFSDPNYAGPFPQKAINDLNAAASELEKVNLPVELQ